MKVPASIYWLPPRSASPNQGAHPRTGALAQVVPINRTWGLL